MWKKQQINNHIGKNQTLIPGGELLGSAADKGSAHIVQELNRKTYR